MKTYKLTPRNFLTPDLTNSKTRTDKGSNEKLFLKKTKKYRRISEKNDKNFPRNIKSSSTKIKNCTNPALFFNEINDNRFNGSGCKIDSQLSSNTNNFLFNKTKNTIDPGWYC